MVLVRLVSMPTPTPTSALIAQPVLSVQQLTLSQFLALRDTGEQQEMLVANTALNAKLVTSAQIPLRKSLVQQVIGLILDQSTVIQFLLV